jgi:SAM-dependent methyltransferase
MRPQVVEFVRRIAATLPLGPPIYEFGSRRVRHQEELANLRPLFPGLEFIGCDMRPGSGVDRIMDLTGLPLSDGIAGTALCLDTLEHVEYVRRAIDEMHRVLQSGGFCILSTVMQSKIHNYPSDYWRFTPEGMRSLLKPFESSWVSYEGHVHFPHTIYGIGAKRSSGWEELL